MADTRITTDKLAIYTGDWNTWRKEKRADCVSFLDNTVLIDEGFYPQIKKAYMQAGAYRKMSAMFPAFQTRSEAVRRFGWHLHDNLLIPTSSMSSTVPYGPQIGFLGGAIIRRSLLETLDFEFSGNLAEDSVRLCLEIWDRGLNCLVDPHSTVVSTDDTLDFPISVPYNVSEETQRLWRRELIG